MPPQSCRAYQRHDRTASTKQVRLSARHWSLIDAKQRELARLHKVRRVSRPVALRYILDEALKAGVCHHQPIKSKEK